MNEYDSRLDTIKHKERVYQLLFIVADELKERAKKHDNSKLESPEKEFFDIFTPKLSTSTYGSEKYKQFLKKLIFFLKISFYICNSFFKLINNEL